jgi:hypothetical protein
MVEAEHVILAALFLKNEAPTLDDLNKIGSKLAKPAKFSIREIADDEIESIR